MDDRSLKTLFQGLDQNRDGLIDAIDLRTLISASGASLSDTQLETLFLAADLNKDGKLDMVDFMTFTNQLASKHASASSASSSSSSPPTDDSKRSFDWESRPAKVVADLWVKEIPPPLQPSKTNDPPHWKVLLAGGVAGAVSRTCTSPLERLKIMFQIQSMQHATKQYSGIFPSLAKMFREEGIRGFWKGNFTNVLRIAPYSAVQFMTFEGYKTFLRKHAPWLNSTGVSLLAGGAGSVSALVATYPLDLVRTRLTIQVHEVKYLGIMHTFRTVVKEEGWAALYKGVGTSSLGMAPYGAINFAVYDGLRSFFVKDRSIGLVESLSYGGLAGATAQTITYPIDLLRRRMQLQGAGGAPRLYSGPIDAATKIFAAEGIKGLYQGMIPCYMKVVPSIAISFCTYEMMRRLLGIEQRKANFGAG